MAEAKESETRVVHVATAAFRQVEHFVYIALGVLLSFAALLALGGGAMELWKGLGDWASTEAIFSIIDRLLFVLLLIEILHTVTASIRTGGLTCEPFLVVGLIASIRRVLIITLQTSEVTKPGHWTADSQSIVQSSMLELGVLGALILILVISIYLLTRRTKAGSGSNDEDE